MGLRRPEKRIHTLFKLVEWYITLSFRFSIEEPVVLHPVGGQVIHLAVYQLKGDKAASFQSVSFRPSSVTLLNPFALTRGYNSKFQFCKLAPFIFP